MRTLLQPVIVLVIFCLISHDSFAQQVPTTRVRFPEQIVSTPFLWRGDSLFARWEPHAVILVPVTLSGCPRVLYMQFDLGSSSSMFYKNTLQSTSAKYPAIMQGNVMKDTLDHVTFMIGSASIQADQFQIKKYGESDINWKDTVTPVIIGTLGTDLINERSLLINYPKQQISIGTNLTAPAEENYAMSEMIFMAGRILLPAVIGGKTTYLFFDTGSSAFSLLTDKPTAMQLAIPNAVPVTHKANSWGGQWSVYTWPSAESAKIAARNIPLQYVSYVESGYSSQQAEQMRRVGIGGVTGNQLFINAVLLVDTKNKKFGIWESGK